MERSCAPAIAAMIRALCCSKNSGLSSAGDDDDCAADPLGASAAGDRSARDAVRLSDGGELLAASRPPSAAGAPKRPAVSPATLLPPELLYTGLAPCDAARGSAWDLTASSRSLTGGLSVGHPHNCQSSWWPSTLSGNAKPFTINEFSMVSAHWVTCPCRTNHKLVIPASRAVEFRPRA